jgi:hypothetical protein
MMSRNLPSIVVAIDCMSCVIPWISCKRVEEEAGLCIPVGGEAASPSTGIASILASRKATEKPAPHLDDMEFLHVHNHQVGALWTG